MPRATLHPGRPAALLASFCLLTIGLPRGRPTTITAFTCGIRATVGFTDVTAHSGIIYNGKSWGSAWGDFNGDGYPDLYTTNHTNRDTLWLNQRNGTFVNVGPTAIPFTQRNMDTHGAMWGDYNNDGHEDVIELTDGGAGTIPQPHLLVNDGAGKLVDRTVALGLDYTPARGRMPLWLDENGDGRLDVLIPTLRRTGGKDLPTALFQQTPAGKFRDVTSQVGVQLSASSQFSQLTDLTGDDRLDLVTESSTGGDSGTVSGTYPTHVFDMTTTPFTDRRASVGLPSVAPMQDAAPVDLNDDGRIDVFVTGGENASDVLLTPSHEVRARLQPSKDQLGFNFKSSGDATFQVYPLYLASRLGTNAIYIGSSGMHPTATLTPDRTGLEFTVRSSDPREQRTLKHSAGVDAGIYIGYWPASKTWSLRYSVPHNGDLVFMADAKTPITRVTPVNFDPSFPGPANHLFMNAASGFTDRIATSGLPVRSQSVNVGAADLNNDMYTDLFIVNTRGAGNVPDQLFLNNGDGTFTRVPSGGGAAGSSVDGRGDDVSIADYDRDGHLDLFVANGRKPDPLHAPYQLFHNDGNANHWLELDLVGNGSTSNRDAIGARVWATAGGVTQLREQNGGIHERGAQNFQRIHFGLGCNTSVGDLKIRWPDGRIQHLTGVAADRILTVNEPAR